MNATFSTRDGKNNHFLMGCYGIGVGRTIAATIEQSHDENGIIWPMALAPYHVDIIVLTPKESKCIELSVQLYELLTSHDLDVIVDNRSESPGVKFKDAESTNVLFA